MSRSFLSIHRRGEKAKLLSVVEELCVLRGRPVCSGDLHAFFREHPDRRPCLLKRLGQQLIGAAQPNDGHVPYLKKIGTFRYKVYYALEDTPFQRRKFADHCVMEKAVELRRWKIPEHVAVLQETGHDALAAHASAGWLAEIDHLAAGHSDPSSIHDLLPVARHILADQTWNGSRFVRQDFVDRDEAWRFLVSQAELRRLWDAPLSPTRHLVRLRWPQCSLFAVSTGYLILREQLHHFVRGKWPIDGEDAQMHAGLAQCLRYGKPQVFSAEGR